MPHDFFFNDTATTEIYTLSLHDALPIFWTFLDRFAFGLAASAVVWLTGGLEAAIVLHAANNVVVFLLAGSLGEGVATESRSEEHTSNSSHANISYAVFCLKKKKKMQNTT